MFVPFGIALCTLPIGFGGLLSDIPDYP